jgi:hypothetical protein
VVHTSSVRIDLMYTEGGLQGGHLEISDGCTPVRCTPIQCAPPTSQLLIERQDRCNNSSQTAHTIELRRCNAPIRGKGISYLSTLLTHIDPRADTRSLHESRRKESKRTPGAACSPVGSGAQSRPRTTSPDSTIGVSATIGQSACFRPAAARVRCMEKLRCRKRQSHMRSAAGRIRPHLRCIVSG